MDLASLVRDVPDYPKPGIVFKDLTPLLADPSALREAIELLADGWDAIDTVVGVEARGFLLAAPVAYRLGAGVVPVRKSGKLPRATYAESYALEYGEATLEVHQDALVAGDRVLLVDDVLATGGTVAATRRLIEHAGAVAHAVAVLMDLSFLPGREAIGALPLTTLMTV